VTWISLAAFLPALGLFFVSFLPNAAQLTLSTGILLVLVVLLNGVVEEMYWRGLYLLEYPDDSRIGFVLAWFLFGAWHISLWFARGVVYKDGFLALVGGAYMLGLLWTWVARSNGNLRAVIPAHILANLFAFTALFVDNGF
jgi:membrane protease YdiL (CAAX protease family)